MRFGNCKTEKYIWLQKSFLKDDEYIRFPVESEKSGIIIGIIKTVHCAKINANVPFLNYLYSYGTNV